MFKGYIFVLQLKWTSVKVDRVSTEKHKDPLNKYMYRCQFILWYKGSHSQLSAEQKEQFKHNNVKYIFKTRTMRWRIYMSLTYFRYRWMLELPVWTWYLYWQNQFLHVPLFTWIHWGKLWNRSEQSKHNI